MVYVISKDGQPLMPTNRSGKVYRLLKNKQAKVIKRCPFTIQLLYETKTSVVQEVVLGQDTGSKHIGTACVSNDKVLYQSQVEIRTDIKSNMDSRRQARRFRRNRKTRYRKPRFLNRKNSTKLDRLPPSVRHKVQAHIDEIEFCKKIMPISKIVLEVSQFDTHLMKNPSLVSEKVKHWGYQKGFNYEYSSRRSAILHRDNYTCQVCGKKHIRLEVHHIIYRSHGGTDDENNLITLCEGCHHDIHAGNIIFNNKPRKVNLKYATHMSIIRSRLLKVYPSAIETFGFVTKENRNHLNLIKGHYIDACVIASGGNIFKCNNEIFYKKRVARQSRQMIKGVRGEQKIPLGKVFGFRRYDKVKYLGQECFIKARRTAGNFVLMDVFNNTLDFRNKGGKVNPSYKTLRRIQARNSILIERRSVIPERLKTDHFPDAKFMKQSMLYEKRAELYGLSNDIPFDLQLQHILDINLREYKLPNDIKFCSPLFDKNKYPERHRRLLEEYSALFSNIDDVYDSNLHSELDRDELNLYLKARRYGIDPDLDSIRKHVYNFEDIEGMREPIYKVIDEHIGFNPDKYVSASLKMYRKAARIFGVTHEDGYEM